MKTVGERLFVSYLVVVVVGLLVSSIAISSLLLRYENDVLRLRLQELSAPLLTAMTTSLKNGANAREVIDALAEQAQSADARLLIVGANRRVLVDSSGTLVGDLLPTPTQANFGTFTEDDQPWVYQQQIFRPNAGGLNPAIIAVARPRAAFADVFRALLPGLLAAAVVSAAFALVVAGLLSRTITRPLRDLVAGARRFARGEYRTRVNVAGPTEVAELGGAFNDMAAEIERSRGSEQAFLADISHELRTPLTSIQGFAQAINEGEASGAAVPAASSIILRESRRLIRMVEGLLEVARLRSGTQELLHERVDPAALIASAVAALEPQANDAGVAFVVTSDGAPPVLGDPDRLAQLFLDLLDNAVKHAPRGTSVAVSAARADDHALVRVRDHGAGLPADAEARLFRRFSRGDGIARDGTGLGLAIAQAIAQAHGGGITARNADGGGAEFTVTLPAA